MTDEIKPVMDDDVFMGSDPIPEEEGLEFSPEEMGGEPVENNTEVEHEPEAQASTEPEKQEDPKPESGSSEPEAESKKEEEPEADPEPVAAESGSGSESESEVVESPTIPKARFDKVLRDKRALENRLEQAEQQLVTQQQSTATPPEQQAEPPTDMVDQKEIAEALLDGDMDKYAELSAKREHQQAELVRRQVMQEVNNTVPQQFVEQNRKASFDTVRQELETQYGFLDPNSDQYDQGIVDTVAGFARSYTEQGYTPADALSEAAEKVIRIEKPELFHVAQQSNETPTPQAQKLKQERLNIDQKLKAAAAQPPATASSDIVGDPIPDFTHMSDADFDKLTDAQLDEYMSQMQKQAAG